MRNEDPIPLATSTLELAELGAMPGALDAEEEDVEPTPLSGVEDPILPKADAACAERASAGFPPLLARVFSFLWRDIGPGLAKGAGSRANNFNLIRMVAASCVLFSHSIPIALGPGHTEPLVAELGMSLGSVSVFIFFSVSGYFIAQSFARSRSRWQFVKARLLRLFPGLAVVLLATIAMGALFTTASAGAYARGAATYFIRNWTLYSLEYKLPGVFEDNPFNAALNGSLWTLSYEVLCYVGVFVVGVTGVLQRPVGMTVVALALALVFVGAPAMEVDLPFRLARFVELGFPFMLGEILFVWRDAMPLNLAIATALSVLAAALRTTFLFPAVFAAALAYVTFLVGCVQSRHLQLYNRLGDYSYGMYVYAFPVQQVAAHFGATKPLLNIACALPVTLLCAVLSWTLVEERALALKNWGRSRRGAAATDRLLREQPSRPPALHSKAQDGDPSAADQQTSRPPSA